MGVKKQYCICIILGLLTLANLAKTGSFLLTSLVYGNAIRKAKTTFPAPTSNHWGKWNTASVFSGSEKVQACASNMDF